MLVLAIFKSLYILSFFYHSNYKIHFSLQLLNNITKSKILKLLKILQKNYTTKKIKYIIQNIYI